MEQNCTKTIICTNETIVDCDTRDIQQIFTAIATGGVPDYEFSWSSGDISGDNNEFKE